MQKNAIEIKSVKGKFILIFSDDVNLYKAISLLDEKLNSSREFFKDAVFREIKGTLLSENDKIIISEFMKEHYDVGFNPLQKKGEETEKNMIKVSENLSVKETENKQEKEGKDEYQKTKFVYETLRSGSLVQFDGHVVIIGDVNPGARVQATGNIIILGTLRGIAHAGCAGNKDTFVFAQRLTPIQLRISNSIVIAPENEKMIEEPLIVRVKDDNIVIESCLLRR